MQINPNEIVDRGIVNLSKYSSIQQIGIDCSLSEIVEIDHGHSVNVDFNETINLPITMYADFKQRSSLSRRGIFVTTGYYDPGYSGSIGCTIYNLSGGPITIDVGERVGQLVCFKADTASTYNGQWQNK